ncbi:MAG: hypothetical protein WKF83_00805 [Nocardioidaceae bacterium]
MVPIALDAAAADFAVGCTYKYLNAGPGAPAFLYVAGRHLPAVRQPIPGWWSASDMFAMAGTYEPAASIRKMLSGTADVLGISAVDEGVELIAAAGIDAIRAKAVTLTGLAVALTDAWLAPHGVEVASPRDARAARGAREHPARRRGGRDRAADRRRRGARLPQPRHDPARSVAADHLLRRALDRDGHAAWHRRRPEVTEPG